MGVRLVRLGILEGWGLMVEYSVIRLWADRVRLVKRWLAAPHLWPDGIDSEHGRWYCGREDYWGGVVGRLGDDFRWGGGVDDEEAWERWSGDRGVGRPRVVEEVSGERPWEAAGVSRATWFRRRKEERSDGGVG